MSTSLVGLNRTRSLVLFGSASRTASVNSADQSGEGCEFLHVIIDVTEVTDTPSLVVTIQGKDPASGKYYTILASAAITAVGTTVLKIGPALTAAANSVANDFVPSIWRVIVTAADTDPAIYSIGANLG